MTAGDEALINHSIIAGAGFPPRDGDKGQSQQVNESFRHWCRWATWEDRRKREAKN